MRTLSKGRSSLRAWMESDKEGVREYIRSWTTVDGETACWIWQRAKNLRGYGSAHVPRRFSKQSGSGCIEAHVVSYESFVEQIPVGLVVRHRCDNPSCCNPAHMEIGTMADNMNDKVARGRQTRGAQHYVAKLNEHQVTVIHELRAEGLTHREISAVAGCGGAQVSRILSGKSWSHFVVANQ